LTTYQNGKWDDVIGLGQWGGEVSKRLEQMRANPRADWRIEEITAVCEEFGISCAAPRSGSSH
jgi:hypothetical protein